MPFNLDADTWTWSDIYKNEVIYKISAQYDKAWTCKRKCRKLRIFYILRPRRGIYNCFKNWHKETTLGLDLLWK